MDNCVFFLLQKMKFELTKYQRSNYQACSPANHMNHLLVVMAVSFSIVFVSVIVFPFVSTADHVDPPSGHDGCQQDFVFVFVFVFSLSLSRSHLPIMLNFPLAITASSKMLKEMFSSSKLSLRSTMKSFTDALDNPVKVVFPKCKSTST